MSLTNTAFFEGAVKASFKKFDKNKSGKIDEDELCAAMAYLYYQLGKRAPGVSDPPTITDVKDAMASFDTNSDGVLDYDEYKLFVTNWCNASGTNFFQSIIVSLLVTYMVVPLVAEKAHDELAESAGLGFIPKKIFVVLFAAVGKAGTILFRRKLED